MGRGGDIGATHPLTAVILAGGKGTRLRPYTTSFPKPLVPVGDRPILEILVQQLVNAGFERLHFAVGHMAGLIEAYFGDGSRWGAEIVYAHEDEPLGTAGPLCRLAGSLPPHFLVINGDVLSDIDYAAFLQGHVTDHDRPALTISTHRRVLYSEYGVLQSDDAGRVTDYLEKPSYDLNVSEGVYAFSARALTWIPEKERFDFPDLVVALLAAGELVRARVHDGLWLDIGRPEDYERAQELVAEYPERFMPRQAPDRSADRMRSKEVLPSGPRV
jgi:NDP-sugar pyrophosphorylase family protein